MKNLLFNLIKFPKSNNNKTKTSFKINKFSESMNKNCSIQGKNIVSLNFWILAFIVCLFFITKTSNLQAQSTFYWCSPGSSGNWSDQNWWNGSTCSVSLPGSEIINFDNSAFTTMTNNAGNTNRYQIFFINSVAARIINGSTNNTFYDYSGNAPKIENDASPLQTINFPITCGNNNGGGLQINPVGGDITFGGSITNGGNDVNVYGTSGTPHNLIISGIMSGSGKLKIYQSAIVQFSGASSFTGEVDMNLGELWVLTGGTPGGNTNPIWLGDGSATANVCKVWLHDGGVSSSRPISVNNGNDLTRFIGGLNAASSTVTYTGTIDLSNNSGSSTYLESTNTGAIVDFQGVIQANNSVAINTTSGGTGTVKFSTNAKTFGSSNTIYINNGTLELDVNVAAKYINLGCSTTNAVNLSLNNGVSLSNANGGNLSVNGATGTKSIINVSGSNTNSYPIILSAPLTFNLTAGTLTQSGAISGSSNNITVTGGTGTLIYNTANSYSSASTTVSAGTLELNAANAINGASNTITVSSGATLLINTTNTIGSAPALTINGGTLDASSVPASCSTTFGTLTVGSGTATIKLNSGVSSTLNFSNSSASSWSGSVNITGWQGSAGSSGTHGQIFVGVGGLVAGQLSQISFSGYPGTPIILPSGELVPPCNLSSAPNTPSSGVTYTNVGGTTMTLNWTSGNGSNRIVIASTSNTWSDSPLNGTNYTANAAFGTTGTTIVSSDGEYVVYNGSGSSVTITGLTVNTTYYFRIYDYNGSGCSINYSSYYNFTQATANGYPTAAANDWNTPSTWIDGVVPPANANVIVNHAITVNAAITYTPVNNITINTGDKITFNAGSPNTGAVTASGTITNGGTIDMTNGGTLTIGNGGTFANNGTFTAGSGTSNI